MPEYKVYIKNRDTMYKPIIEKTIKVEWQRGFTPGVLTFKVVKDQTIDYQEGNPVVLMQDDTIIFVGYVFKKARKSNQIIETTCYDQLRYFKNKDALQYANKSYSELLTMICNDHGMKIGEVEDTKYKIPMRTERDKEYYQMLQVASELTIAQTGKEFVLYDDKGGICLKEWKNIPTMENIITYDIAQNYEYTTSIDQAYNRIKVNYIDDVTKEVKTYGKEDEQSIKDWGTLQYYAETSTLQDIDTRIQIMLDLLNKKHRTLRINKVIGDFRVRAGSLVPVYFPDLGDIHVNSLMLVDKVTHTIDGEYHMMELEVFNKDIMPPNSGKGLFEGAKSRQRQNPDKAGGVGGSYSGSANTGAQHALAWAQSKIGWTYSQGKRKLDGYADCSSLIMRAYQDAGLLPKGSYNLTSRSIHSDSRFEQITKDQLKPGDIMWSDGHLAMYTGGDNTVEARWSTQKVGNSKMGNRFSKFYRLKGAHDVKQSPSISVGGEAKIGGNMVHPMPASYRRGSSNYGNRTHPILKTKKMHTGVDFPAPKGTPVSAAQGGTVIHAGPAGTYGNLVKIRHPGGTETRYAHLSSVNVKVGQNVDIGQKIGGVGTTGRSTGNHLHFEVRVNGATKNPKIFI